MREEAQRLAAVGTLSLLGLTVPGSLLDLSVDRAFTIRTETEGDTVVLTDEQSEFSLRLLPSGLALPVGTGPGRHLVFQLVEPRAAVVTEAGDSSAVVRLNSTKTIEFFHPAAGTNRWFIAQ